MFKFSEDYIKSLLKCGRGRIILIRILISFILVGFWWKVFMFGSCRRCSVKLTLFSRALGLLLCSFLFFERSSGFDTLLLNGYFVGGICRICVYCMWSVCSTAGCCWQHRICFCLVIFSLEIDFENWIPSLIGQR